MPGIYGQSFADRPTRHSLLRYHGSSFLDSYGQSFADQSSPQELLPHPLALPWIFVLGSYGQSFANQSLGLGIAAGD